MESSFIKHTVLDSNPGTGQETLSKTAHTGSGAHPATYSTRTGLLFRGYIGQGADVHHSLPSSAEVKNEWTSVPPTCLHGVDRDRFTF